MILSFINIRKVPREMLKTEGEFNTSLGTLRMLMNGKSCLIPILNTSTYTFKQDYILVTSLSINGVSDFVVGYRMRNFCVTTAQKSC